MKQLNWYFLVVFAGLFCLLQGCSRKSGLSASAVTGQEDLASIESPYARVYSGMTFDTHIRLSGRQVSGLMHFRQVYEDHWRIAFTAKVGQTLFDFEIQRDTFIIRRCVEQLRKQIILDHLERDLRLVTGNYGRVALIELVAQDNGTIHRRFRISGARAWWHHLAGSASHVRSISWGKRRKFKTTVTFDGYEEGLPRHVRIDHKTIVNFEIEMQMIPVQH